MTDACNRFLRLFALLGLCLPLQFWGQQTDDNDKTRTADAVWFSEEVTTKARVLSKPEPEYTAAAKMEGASGVVILRAVFGADGKVRHILILSGVPGGLTEEAVNAARRIKFTPAAVNGVPVSTMIQLEYNFNLF